MIFFVKGKYIGDYKVYIKFGLNFGFLDFIFVDNLLMLIEKWFNWYWYNVYLK